MTKRDDEGSYRRGSRHADSDRGRSKGRGRSQRSSASYKSELDKLFQSGGDVPERFKGLMEGLKPEEGSAEAEWAAAVQELRQTESFLDFARKVREFKRAGHRLPDDEELLIRMLDHPDERILGDVLTHLLDLNERRQLQRVVPIKSRLPTIKSMSDDPKLHELADRLEKALKK